MKVVSTTVKFLETTGGMGLKIVACCKVSVSIESSWWLAVPFGRSPFVRCFFTVSGEPGADGGGTCSHFACVGCIMVG